MNLGLDLSMKLQQKLSFQMIQSLKLLQVNTLQLEQLLKTELEMNPVLEESDEPETEEEAPEKDEAGDEKEDDPELEVNEDKVDWEEYLEEGFDIGGRMSEETDPNKEHFEPQPVHQVTLDEHLTAQLNDKNVEEKQKLLVKFLISSLEPDGYLRLPLKDIADYLGITEIAVEEALKVVWTMEPAGIGARNLQECLRLQLARKHRENSLAMRIITEAWDLFEKLKLPEIARQVGVDVREVQAAADEIKTLHPRPGSLVTGEIPSTIVPDLIVEKVDGQFEVYLNDRSVPMVHINRSYMQLIKRGGPAKKEVKNYIREKLNSAAWLVRSIEQRRTTMLKVMSAIVERQMTFFEKGPPNLNPLKLQDIATMVGMHISTVSRVTSNKYVQTPHGIFELKYFFTESMGQDLEGGDVSAEKIRNRIRELIETENTKKPLSDQKLSDILAREGFTVARRTVAKYREQQKLLPARMRQKYD
ncbi:MAG TPA: RNA polymerase factor sigma-54 [Chitinivibrionales bacterium]|nr:RNA polymerase factor sigma-54 [Chitinivibrionales bacterium]